MTRSTTVREDSPSGEQPRDRRAERYAARETLWRESGLERIRICGKRPIAVGGIGVKASGAAGHGRAAGFSGLSTCSSTWACTVCSAKIAATRQQEISAAVRAWQQQGHTVTMVTLTMRHHLGQGLATLWDACGYAWGAVTSGKGWVAEKARYDVAGWLRLVEVTYGDNGWHVHVHALVFTRATSRWAPADLGPLMFQRWRRALMRKDLRSPSAEHGGLHVKVMGGDAGVLGDYFTKSVYRYDERSAEHAGLEVARGDLKGGRMGNRTPFQMLADLVRDGDAADLERWLEWEQGSLGRRQLTWSKGLRALLLGDEPELTDQEIAEQEIGGDLVLVVQPASWRSICATPGGQTTVLHLAESDDTGDNLRAWLRAHGYGWLEVTEWREFAALKALERRAVT